MCYATTVSADVNSMVTRGSVEHDGDSAFVFLTLNPDEIDVGDKEVLSIRPRLEGRGGQRVDLPAIHVMGRHPYYRHIRGQELPNSKRGDKFFWIKYCYNKENKLYMQGVPFQAWMDSTSLVVTIESADTCGGIQSTTATVMQTASRKQILVPAPLIEEKLQLTGTANIQFLNNDTHLLPGWQDNENELQKILNSLNQALNDTSATLLKLHLHGYASPDGPYFNNRRLAKERTDSVVAYIVEHTKIQAERIDTNATPEDWTGLRRYIEQASEVDLPNKNALLRIADSVRDPDSREGAMRRYSKDFAYLLEHCLPRLRRTDYKIDYTSHHLVEQPPVIDSVWHMPVSKKKLMQEPITDNSFLPIIALKTNMLGDVLITPNIEAELPLGKKNKYSLMAEFWIPWYVWHHNSRAYEIMLFGAELRKWYGKCRDRNRPPLTGFFAGAYAAGGKYDIEWNSVGDQGEFFSLGLSAGYCWPVARRLNLELSGSIGAIWGPRRHYNGEFDDTHLIWKYNSSIFYAGPTKVKFSLVWLMGNKMKTFDKKWKGGVAE